jgi:hypothetical protein
VIFSRRRGNAGRHGGTGNGADNRGRARDRAVDPAEATEAARTSSDPTGPVAEFGPYDVAQAPNDQQERLDLGALRIPAVAGVEIHLQAGPQGQIQQIQLAHETSRLSLAIYAAPRTEGIWDEIRETLRTQLVTSGAKPEAIEGDYGPELRAKLREGSVTTDMRHVGIDGPRWFLHAVFLGDAAYQPDQAGPLLDVLRGLVVDRGDEARPVSEALPLRLPPEAAAQLEQSQNPDQQDT